MLSSIELTTITKHCCIWTRHACTTQCCRPVYWASLYYPLQHMPASTNQFCSTLCEPLLACREGQAETGRTHAASANLLNFTSALLLPLVNKKEIHKHLVLPRFKITWTSMRRFIPFPARCCRKHYIKILPTQVAYVGWNFTGMPNSGVRHSNFMFSPLAWLLQAKIKCSLQCLH